MKLTGMSDSIAKKQKIKAPERGSNAEHGMA